QDAVANLEGFKNLGPHRLAIHSLENQGDRVTREALAQLFTDGASPSDLVKWKDLYDLLETTMDQCEHVANVWKRRRSRMPEQLLLLVTIIIAVGFDFTNGF